MLFDNNTKPFEVPDTGYYVGVLVDIIDLGEQQTQWGPQFQTRFVWSLDKTDSEGNPFQAINKVSATLFAGPPESKLHAMVKSILGTAPPIPFEGETLIGKSNLLCIEKITTLKGKPFAKINAILPLMPNQAPLPIPTGYIRSKDRVKKPQQGPMTPPVAKIPTSQQTPPAAQSSVNLSAATDNTGF